MSLTTLFAWFTAIVASAFRRTFGRLPPPRFALRRAAPKPSAGGKPAATSYEWRGTPLLLVSAMLATAACGPGAAGHGAQPRKVTLVVTGGTVVTMDPTRRVLSPGAVAIEGTEIVAVDTLDRIRDDYDPTESIDARGGVILPGLINTHTHAPMVLYRGLADDLALMDWLERYIFPAEARTVSPDFVRVGARLAAVEMIESGTTTFADMYYFEEAIADQMRQAGLRAVLGQTIIQFPVADAKTPADGLARAERFIQGWRDDRLIVPAVAPHAMYTLDREALIAARDLARRYTVPLLIHLAETRDEDRISRERHGTSPTGYLESIGFWGPRMVAAHGVWLSDDDIQILRRRGIAVSHNPESNMKLASGIAPILKYRAAGVVIGLGTDGAASNNDLDMFEAMRQTAFLQKVASGDPRALPAPVALEMATLGGARALGLDRLVGSLERGKRADLIVVSLEGARQTPVYDVVSHLVYVSRGADVRATVVNGQVLMRERRVLTLDVPTVLAEARAMAVKVREAVQGAR